MKKPHLLIDIEKGGILSARLVCMECICTWWVAMSDLKHELRCPRCGHCAHVETDNKKALL